MRRSRFVAFAALTAAFALVAVPGMAESRKPAPPGYVDSSLFRPVVGIGRGPATAIAQLDPAYRSAGALEPDSTMLEPADAPWPSERPDVRQPAAPTGVIVIPTWRYDPNVSFYGPGFYGKRTACGQAYTTEIMGVAHRTLPCGTLVKFRNPANGRTITVPVIDRGPYVDGRQWDLSGAACEALRHCYTGPIYWRFP